jgi:hypothetical protein
MREYSVRYYRLSRLLLELTQAKADGSYSKLLKQLAKLRLLALDDWGLATQACTEKLDAFAYRSLVRAGFACAGNVCRVPCRGPSAIRTFL